MSFHKSLAMPGVAIQSESPLTAYIGRIIPTRLTVARIMPVPSGQVAGRIWQEQLKPVFTGYCVSAADPTQDLEFAGKVARSRIARMFWEQTMRGVIRSRGFSLEATLIERAAAAEVTRHAESGGLPKGLIMELERVPLERESASTGSEEDFLAWMRAFSAPRLTS